MTVISRGQGCLRSNSQTRCPFCLAMSLPSFVGITKIDWEGRKVQKCEFFDVKWPLFRGILSIWAQILPCTQGPPEICVCKYNRDLCKVEGARSGQRSLYTFSILMWQWRRGLQINQTHIGPILHVRAWDLNIHL